MDIEMLIPEEARVRYLERRKKDIESLRSALNTRSFEEFKRVGHQLKGNASSFGYGDLEKLAIQIEQAGEARDHLAASRQLDLFENWLQSHSKLLG